MRSITTNSFCLAEETDQKFIDESIVMDEYNDDTRFNIDIINEYMSGNKLYARYVRKAVIGLIDFQDELSIDEYAMLVVVARKIGISLK